MATISRLVRETRVSILKNEFASHTGIVGVEKAFIEDQPSKYILEIVAVDAVTPANFAAYADATAVPDGSRLTCLATGKMYVKASGTFADVTD
jgi:hypothetical protein